MSTDPCEIKVRKWGIEFGKGLYKPYWDELDTPAKRASKLRHMRLKIWFTEAHEQTVRNEALQKYI